MKSRLFVFAFLVVCLALAVPAVANELYPVKVERNIEIKMRDGVILRGDIFPRSRCCW